MFLTNNLYEISITIFFISFTGLQYQKQQRMQPNQTQKIEPKNSIINPQSAQTIQPPLYMPTRSPRYTNTLASGQQYLNKLLQVNKNFRANEHCYRSREVDQESVTSSQSSRISFYKDWSIAELIQQKKVGRGREATGNELEELKHTLKKIMKSNEDYRKKILQANQQKAQIKLQNTILVKQIEHINNQKKIWDIQQSQYIDIQNNLKSQINSAKENYNKALKRLQSEIQNLNQKIEFERKRNNDLDAYNKDLFTKINLATISSSQLLKLKNSQTSLGEQLIKIQKQLNKMFEQNSKLKIANNEFNQNQKYLKTSQRQLQKRLNSIEQSQKSSKLQIIKLQSDNEELKKQKNNIIQKHNIEIAQMIKRLQAQKVTSAINHRQIHHQQQATQSLQFFMEQNRIMREKVFRYESESIIKNQLQLKLIQYEHKIAENDKILIQTQLVLENTQQMLKNQRLQFKDNYQKLQEFHSQQIKQLQLNLNNKLIQVSNLLLNEQKKTQQIQYNLQQSSAINKKLSQRICKLQAQVGDCQQMIAQKQLTIEQLNLQMRNYEILCITNAAQILQLQVIIKSQQKMHYQARKQHTKQTVQAQSLLKKLQDSLKIERQQNEQSKINLGSFIQQMGQRRNGDKIKYDQQISQVKQKAQQLQLQMNKVSSLCQSNQNTVKQKEILIQGKNNSVLNKLNILVEQMRNKITSLEFQRAKLYQKIKQNQIQKENLNKIILNKDIQMAKVLEQMEYNSQTSQKIIRQCRAQNQFLKINNQQLRQKCIKIQEKYYQNQLRSEEQLAKIKRIQKRYKITQQILQNLIHQIRQSQGVSNQLNHPPPNGIKKFVNLINASHRSNFNRQIQKILQYYSKIEDTKALLLKHLANMRFIFNLIEQQWIQFKES